MSLEQLFRLVSVALLGMVAVACTLKSPSDPAPSTAFTSPAALRANPPSFEEELFALEGDTIEVDSIEEVEQINSGRFKPYEIGAVSGNR